MAQLVLALVLIAAGVLILLRGLRALSRAEPGPAADRPPGTGADRDDADRDDADRNLPARTEPGRYLALAGVGLIAVGVLALLT